MEKPRTKPKQGSILISEPSLRDFYFRQSVILLAEHNEDGSFGVIINKPIEARLKDIIKGFTGYNLPVYLGGPVKTDSIFFIHLSRLRKAARLAGRKPSDVAKVIAEVRGRK